MGQLTGSALADILAGDASADTMVGADGDDYIAGASGDDTIDGGAGNDTIYGGAGADVLTGGPGNDVFIFAVGDSGLQSGHVDVITDWTVGDRLAISSVGANPMSGGVFYTASSFDEAVQWANLLFTTAYNTVVTIHFGPGTLAVFYDAQPGDGSADDVILLLNSPGFDVLSNNFITMPGLPANAPPGTPAPPPSVPGDPSPPPGTPGADTLVGSHFGESIAGLAGDDSIAGQDGPDDIAGGTGNDTLVGDNSDDTLNGGAGDDLMSGGSGLDRLSYAGASGGVHVSLSLTGAQAVGGGQGVDTFSSVEGIIGGDFDDWLGGSTEGDLLSGGVGADTLSGGGGNDTLEGGQGDDYLIGGTGDDLIALDAGHDVVRMGAGADLVTVGSFSVPASSDAADTILDWSTEDELMFGYLAGGDYAETTALSYTAATTAANHLIALGLRYVSVQVGADVYVYGDTSKNGGQAEDVVRLAQTSLDEISSANIRQPPEFGGPVPQASQTAPGTPIGMPLPASDLSNAIGAPTLGAYAYDAVHGAIYLSTTAGGLIHYDVATKTTGPTVQLGGSLESLAVSPDGQYLLAADHNVTAGADTLYRVWLGSGAVDTLHFAVSGPERGITDVAIASDGAVMLTTDFAGSGWNLFRSFVGDAASPVFSPMTGQPALRASSYLNTSEDGSLLLIQEAGIPDGPVRLYDTTTGQISYNIATGGFNGGLGDLNAARGLVVDQVGFSLKVFDTQLRPVADVSGAYAEGDTLAGVQFNENGEQLFIWNATQHKIVALDTYDWSVVGSLDVAASPASPGLSHLSGGLDVIGGGRLLVLATSGGLQLVDLSQRLSISRAGSASDDILNGAAGTDTLSGGAGADTLIGYGGADSIAGETGNDSIDGGDGDNILRGNEGDDVIVGGSGFDNINGNTGHDVAHGGAGNDWVLGGQDSDELWGDGGNDILNGNLGIDYVHGGDGNDAVRGGQSSDVLWGDAGNDTLWGDRDDDFLYGGAGADVFHISPEAGLDRVYDYSYAEGDRVALSPGGQYVIYQFGADTVIDIAAGGLSGRLIVLNTQLASLPPDWIFVG